jgi:hypothetical protein
MSFISNNYPPSSSGSQNTTIPKPLLSSNETSTSSITSSSSSLFHKVTLVTILKTKQFGVGLTTDILRRKNNFHFSDFSPEAALIEAIGRLGYLLLKPVSFIPFGQDTLLPKLDPQQHKTLLKICHQFNGLCELVCNRVLVDNLLEKSKYRNHLKKQITVDRLNEESIKNSHILYIYPIFCKILAYLFRIYPDNFFSYFDQRKLIQKKSTNNKIIAVNRQMLGAEFKNLGDGETLKFETTHGVNRQILGAGFKNLEVGETLKFETIHNDWFRLGGHSLLIKKTSDTTYTFFDPNFGEARSLSFLQLCNEIDWQIQWINASDVFFIRGSRFLKKLEICPS